jgi:hypothetical protein
MNTTTQTTTTSTTSTVDPHCSTSTPHIKYRLDFDGSQFSECFLAVCERRPDKIWMLCIEPRNCPEDDEGVKAYIDVREDGDTHKMLQHAFVTPDKMDYSFLSEKAKQKLAIWESSMEEDDIQEEQAMEEEERKAKRQKRENSYRESKELKTRKIFLNPYHLSVKVYDGKRGDVEIFQEGKLPFLNLRLRLIPDEVFIMACRLKILPTANCNTQDYSLVLHDYSKHLLESVDFVGDIEAHNDIITPLKTFYPDSYLASTGHIKNQCGEVISYVRPSEICMLGSKYSLQLDVQYNVIRVFRRGNIAPFDYVCQFIGLRVVFPEGKKREGGIRRFQQQPDYVDVEQYNSSYLEREVYQSINAHHVFTLTKPLTVTCSQMKTIYATNGQDLSSLPNTIPLKHTASRFALSHVQGEEETALESVSYHQRTTYFVKSIISSTPLLGFLKDVFFAGMHTDASESFRKNLFSVYMISLFSPYVKKKNKVFFFLSNGVNVKV